MNKIWTWQAICEQVLCNSGSDSPLSQYRQEAMFFSCLKMLWTWWSQKPHFMIFFFFIAIILLDSVAVLLCLSSVSPTLHRQNTCGMPSSWLRPVVAGNGSTTFALEGLGAWLCAALSTCQDTSLCCCKALASPRSFLLRVCSPLQQRCSGPLAPSLSAQQVPVHSTSWKDRVCPP